MPSRAFNLRQKNKATAWLATYLGRKYSVPYEKVKPKDQLKNWGFVHEGHFADLVADYNQATHADPEWKDSALSPPELIDGLGGARAKNKTVADLVDFLASKTAKTARPVTKDQIQQILISNLAGEGPSVGPGTKLGPDPTKCRGANCINPSTGGLNAIYSDISDLGPTQAAVRRSFKDCMGECTAISRIAKCMADRLSA